MQILLILTSLRNMPWQYMLISCVSNVKNHILVGSKIVNLGQKKTKENSIQKSQSAQIAVKSLWNTVRSMEKTTQNSNVSSAALSHNGSVDKIKNNLIFYQVSLTFCAYVIDSKRGQHISVNPAIINSVKAIMYPNILRINCQCNKEGINVELGKIISRMGKKLLQDVRYVETLEITKKPSEKNQNLTNNR